MWFYGSANVPFFLFRRENLDKTNMHRDKVLEQFDLVTEARLELEHGRWGSENMAISLKITGDHRCCSSEVVPPVVPNETNYAS